MTGSSRDNSNAADSDYLTAILATVISTSVGLSLVAGIFWAVQDRRKKVDAVTAAFYLERERLQVAFASIGDGVIICDCNLQITFLNPVAEKLTGWSANEARGQPISEVFRIIAEDTRSTVENPAARAMREESIVVLSSPTLLISKSGQEIPVDDSASPVRDSHQNMIGTVLVFRDVTERRNEERRLHEAAEFTRSIVDTLGELVVVLDEDMQVLHVNRAFSTTFQLTDDRILGDLSIRSTKENGISWKFINFWRALLISQMTKLASRLTTGQSFRPQIPAPDGQQVRCRKSP